MTDDETIAAIVTPPGPGGLGVVRLSGAGALAAGDRLFRPDGGGRLSQAPSHSLHHGAVVDGGDVLDDGVAAVFRAPRSYTGEDVVELSCHGSPALLKRVLQACLKAGTRPAGPGEFTRRAFLNGKMDLAQAEAVAALVGARSERARRWALDQLRGGLSARLKEFRDGLISLLARLEASLDFAEEEVPDLPRPDLVARLEALRRRLNDLLATAPRGRLFREGVRAVLIGKPNAGKSSLFNALLESDRAIVADAPGTTRDTLEEAFSAGGLPVVLTDTAGLRPGADAVEAEGVARTRRALELADVALWVVDASDPFSPADLEAARSLDGKAVAAVLNKADLLPAGGDRIALERRALELAPGARACLFVSARTGAGLDDLRRTLAALAPDEEEAPEGPTLVTERHEALAREASQALAEAAAGAARGAPEEALAADLKRALGALGRITGADATDEVLDAIFSRFCIGK